ncbi:MAG TPA: 2-isopropylmalate synthase [Actinomycetota bacterium]
MVDRLILLDTTLRDGEQAPGIALSPDEKVRIARQLERLGVDVIEAGFPVTSPGELEAVSRIARIVRTCGVAALCRARAEDITLTWSAIGAAERPRLKVFISTSDVHLTAMMRMTRAQVLDVARRSVALARRHTADVQFSAQDATRTDPEFLVEVFRAAAEEGATTVSLPDTVGYALPDEFGALVRSVREAMPPHVQVSTHCHDDLGLAVANSLAGVANGARQVEVAVNGIGERAGNCSLEEIAAIVAARGPSLGLWSGLNLREIADTSRLVAKLTGYPIQPNKAVVGANAFTHEAGIHQHGMLSDRLTYEILDPEQLGLGASRIVLGKHSGRHGFANALARLGLDLPPDAFDRAFARFKDLADGRVPLTEDELRRIAADALVRPAPA